jgi:hypothetical protein
LRVGRCGTSTDTVTRATSLSIARESPEPANRVHSCHDYSRRSRQSHRRVIMTVACSPGFRKRRSAALRTRDDAAAALANDAALRPLASAGQHWTGGGDTDPGTSFSRAGPMKLTSRRERRDDAAVVADAGRGYILHDP